jgi:16S rRNA (adenine1518-N6/adenine1519-N6)-dimethyltransferase
VMRLVPREPDPRALDEAFFTRVVKAAFATRRKTLRNTLATKGSALGLPAGEVLAGFEAVGLDPGRRGETLTVAQFVYLSNELLTRRESRGG